MKSYMPSSGLLLSDPFSFPFFTIHLAQQSKSSTKISMKKANTVLEKAKRGQITPFSILPLFMFIIGDIQITTR
jgi:hypothetical protein